MVYIDYSGLLGIYFIRILNYLHVNIQQTNDEKLNYYI